jgi:hypothetical protein
MPSVIRLLALALVGAALASCGEDAPSGSTCGEGTQLIGTACVPTAPAVVCGAGTIASEGLCVPVGGDASAGDTDPGTDGGPDASGPDAEEPDVEAPDTGGDEDLGSDDVPPDAEAPIACEPPCGPAEACVLGVCVREPPPGTWTCEPDAYADGETCDCACGAPDPDCADGGLPVTGCTSGFCQEDGQCAPCDPSCDGKACGDDGCGGQCGYCSDPNAPLCLDGACSACVPGCDGKECGDDGCGGSCGACMLPLTCVAGICGAVPAEESCVGFCGGTAPSGCGCGPSCATEGGCCVDVYQCGCQPVCAPGACGDDGCGGTCGACPAGQLCGNGTCVVQPCTALTCNGNGTCDDATGECACNAGFDGLNCEVCASGFVGWPGCGAVCTSDADCDDSNACTSDVCTAGSGCLRVPVDGKPCDDGDVCTAGDACQAGACKPGGVCDDGDTCTADTCQPGVGCKATPIAAMNGKPCDDDDACTSSTTCVSGACSGGSLDACDDGNECTSDACDSATGCTHEPNTLPCALDTACSLAAACLDGACTSLFGVDCDDGDPCTSDACVGATGGCQNELVAEGSACEDGDLCTVGEFCDMLGQCLGATRRCDLGVTAGLVARWTAAEASSVGHDGLGVYWWSDAVNGHGLQPVVESDAPEYLPAGGPKGHPGLRLGGSSGLQGLVPELGVIDEASVFVVLCTESTDLSGTFFSHGSGWSLEGAPGGSLRARAGNTTADRPFGAPGCFAIATRVGAGGLSLDLAATDTTTAVASGAAPLAIADGTAIQLGPLGAGVVVSELLYYDRAVTDDERDAVLTYLRTAWDLPAPIPDQGWFDAADIASLVLSQNGGVAAWQDKSASGRHLTAPDATAAPLWDALGAPGQKPAITFTDTTRLVSEVVSSTPELTVIGALAVGTPGVGGSVVTQASGGQLAFALRRSACSGCTGQLEWAAGGTSASPVATLDSWTWTVLVATRAGGQATLATVGQPEAPVASGAIPGVVAPLVVGNTLDGTHSMEGAIGELRLFGRGLHRADRAFVVSQLRAAYGL